MTNTVNTSSKRGLFWLVIGYTFFVIYGSLVPFNIESRTLYSALQHYFSAYSADWSMARRTDWFANFLLFIPLTFLWLAALWNEKKKACNVLLTILIPFMGWALCSGIEFTQLFFKERTVSINDIVAETTGGIFGVVLWWWQKSNFLHWFTHLVNKERKNRWHSYVQLYVFIMLAYNVMPLDLTLSPVELFHKWQENKIRIIPFLGWQGDAFQLIFSFIADVLIWVPLPFLWLKSASLDARGVFLRVVTAAAAIEFCQLFVLSRYTDSSDIITAAIGAWLGIKLALYKNSSTQETTYYHASAQKKAYLYFLCWSIILMLLYWYPYNFTVDKEIIRVKLHEFTGPLFAPYYSGSEFTAITQIVRKSLLGLPLGITLGYASTSQKKLSIGTLCLYLMLPALVLLFIELSQLFVPSKVVHQTDFWIGFIGSIVGFFIIRSLLMEELRGENRETKVQPTENRPATLPVRLSLPRPLIAFLMMYFGLLCIAKLPGLPYNMVELLHGSWLPLQALLLSLTGSVILGGPMLLIQKLSEHKKYFKIKYVLGVYTLFLLGSSILLRLTVPLESLYDIIGSPTWGVLIEAEFIFRTFGVLAFPTGALFLVSLYFVKSTQTFTHQQLKRQFCFFYFFVILPCSYTIVVLLAGTDNLVELLRNQGYSYTLLGIPLYTLLLSWLAVSYGFIVRRKNVREMIIWVLAVAISIPLGYILISWATEPAIIKYNKIFSALQFLLSTDRNHYLPDSELYLRFALTEILLIFGIGFMQPTLWQKPPLESEFNMQKKS